MSLLMDALRRADEAKRKGNNQAETIPSALPPNPPTSSALPSAAPPGTPLPDLSLHIDAVDADLAIIAKQHEAFSTFPPSRPSVSGGSEAIGRAAARNLFSAKQHAGSNAGLWLFLGFGVLAAIGIGGYFWWQLQGVIRSSPMGAPSLPSAQAALTTAPTVDLRGTTARPAALPQLPAGVSSAPPPPPARGEANAPAGQAQRSSATPLTASRAAVPDNLVRLSKTPPRTNPALERAYDALLAGRVDDARRDYEHVLRDDARNTDALLGLATIAARQGQIEKAHAFYLHALESDPNDATAQAGLISTRGQANADFSESRLKTALSGHPDSPALHFALGNLYARQERWGEAQQSYFQAYSIEPDNADFIFNLAVSLDHLNQNKLAAQYYRMALSAAETRAASFDKAQADHRILELQP